MNAHNTSTSTSTAVATLRPLREVVAEYDDKRDALATLIVEFTRAVASAKSGTSIGGAYGGDIFGRGGTPDINLRSAEAALLKSAWRHVYEGLNIERIASPKDKDAFSIAMQNPAPFTIENIAATFGDFIKRPRHHILRGMAEIFSGLDQAYKSHDKMKVGVAGLPKRVIIGGFGGFSGYGEEQLRAVVNALRSYRGEPIATYGDIRCLVEEGALDDLKLKRFSNGNGHIHFGPQALLDINRALAEFYGDVLPDTPDEVRPEKKASTAVSKDLQFYPTPNAVIQRIIRDIRGIRGASVLEPSCGDGRMMQAVLRAGAGKVLGVEVDASRVAEARSRGLPVHAGNFLELTPEPSFDIVLMNPPFYGKHYAKHVTHATKFLKPRGQLIAILPITARTDHGLLGSDWQREHGMTCCRDGFTDLPVGSFAESGTNINTTVFQAEKKA